MCFLQTSLHNHSVKMSFTANTKIHSAKEPVLYQKPADSCFFPLYDVKLVM